MVVSGIGFGVAVMRATALPVWTGWLLALGVVLVAATQGAGEGVQLIAAALRTAGFAGMGAALLASRRAQRP